MGDVIKKMKQKFEDDADELMELRGDVLLNKTDLNMKILGVLLRKFIDTADELLENKSSDNTAKDMKEILSSIKEAVGSIKFPELKQQINFDTKPLISLNENIKRQNDNISALIKKIPQENNEGGVSRELLQMIARNNEFINKATQQYDYSKVLKEIADGLNRKEEKSEIKFPTLKVERTTGGFIQKLIPVT